MHVRAQRLGSSSASFHLRKRNVSSDRSIIFDPAARLPATSYQNAEGSSGASFKEAEKIINSSPLRRCIITRTLFPSRTPPPPFRLNADEAVKMIKLKPRSFEGGQYLVPSATQEGRSFYLGLESNIAKLQKPGALKPYGLSIPSKLQQWINATLVQDIKGELERLVERLRTLTPRPQPGSSKVYPSFPEVARLVDPNTKIDSSVLVQLPPSPSPALHQNHTTLVDLSTLPFEAHSSILRLVHDLLYIERGALLRRADKRHVEAIPDLAGKMLALSTASTRGQLALPTIIALRRWQMLQV